MKYSIFIMGALMFLLMTSFSTKNIDHQNQTEFELFDDSCYMICTIQYNVCRNSAKTHLNAYNACLRNGNGARCLPKLSAYYSALHACSVARSVCLAGC